MRIETNGAALSVTQYGDGAPILLVHGFPFSGAMWAPVGERLGRAGFRAIVPDLRGFGGSTGQKASGLATYADDLCALLDELNVRSPIPWVGFSMGGYVVLEAWRRCARRIGALALVDTRAAADDDAGRAGRHATAARVELEGSSVVADAMAPKLFAADASEPLRRSTYEQMTSAPPDAVVAALRAMAARPDSTATLATICVPTVVVVGADDVITPPRDSQALAMGIAGARLRVIEAAGHLSPLEQPDAVASAIRELAPPPTVAAPRA